MKGGAKKWNTTRLGAANIIESYGSNLQNKILTSSMRHPIK